MNNEKRWNRLLTEATEFAKERSEESISRYDLELARGFTDPNDPGVDVLTFMDEYDVDPSIIAYILAVYQQQSVPPVHLDFEEERLRILRNSTIYRSIPPKQDFYVYIPIDHPHDEADEGKPAVVHIPGEYVLSGRKN